MGTFHSAKLTGNRTSVKKMWNIQLIFRNRYVIFRNQYVHDTEKIRILTSTSLREQQVSMFTQLAVEQKCAHNGSTISRLRPSCRTSSKGETLARMGSCGSTTPASSVIKSSRNLYSRSRRKISIRMILAR